LLDVCDNCGIPLLVGRGLAWHGNGTISLAGSPKNRMVFFESDTIDQLFKGIEKLIGIPIAHLVIESRARETRKYIAGFFPPEMRESHAFKLLSGKEPDDSISPEEKERQLNAIKSIADTIIDISRVYGYGDQRRSDLWDTGAAFPWRTQVIRNPYSLLFIAADNVGSVEVFEETEMRVKYEEIAEDTYEIGVFPGKRPAVLKERLQRKNYDLKPGDIEYERCPRCGVPLEVAQRKWNCADGTYTDPDTGRRMAIFGPAAVDAIFDDLQYELGDAITNAAIEAQRQYLKSAWSEDQWNRSGSAFHHMIAVRGLGNLTEFKGDAKGLALTIQNACLELATIGTVQALVELAYRSESSTCEWELTGEGDLNIIINPA
jgi:hypothetical protein